ncbi:hypothetical protein [Nostoc sp. DSM 114161]
MVLRQDSKNHRPHEKFFIIPNTRAIAFNKADEFNAIAHFMP